MRYSDHFRGRRVVVTGHTGFKGSWLTLWLTELGAEVTGFALPPETEPSLFVDARLGEICEHVEGDIRNPTALEKTFKDCRPETVFHLAAQPLVRRSYKEPRETFEVNVMGTVNVLEAVRKNPSVEAVVMVTTDKVYESREWIWGYRENDPLGGFDPYSASKAAAETVIASYRRAFFDSPGAEPQVGLASARAGNVIGGGDWADDRVIPDAMRAIMNRRVLEVRNPRSIRPWQHVLEPLGAYLVLAKALAEDSERYSGAWNFGPNSDDVVDVGQLVKLFVDRLGRGEWRDASIKSTDAPHETGLLKLSSEKARTELGWQPVWDSLMAVDLTASWYGDVLFGGIDGRNRCLKDIEAYANAVRMRGERHP